MLSILLQVELIESLCCGGCQSVTMEPTCRKDKSKLNSTPTRGDRAKQKSAQQELKQRQRAEIYALNKVMTELEQQQFEAFCKQMQSQGE
uniref:Small vasohibin-binding protein n=2 Tax=Hucho hucho TaxID=62062 RepID=A0A4W5Q2B8_9TELE